MLASALRRLDKSTNAEERVYAVETRPGARTYTVMSPNTAWEHTNNAKTAHLYEVLSGPCNMYLDIEWKCDTAPRAADEQDVVQNVIKHTCAALLRVYNESSTVVTSVSASGVQGARYKCSWHVHIQCAHVCWLNAVAVGQFVRSACADISVVDKIPYAGTGQNWRCVGSAKYAEPSRKFSPADRKTFMNCTVQQAVGARRVIYPDVPLAATLSAVPDHIRKLASTLVSGGPPIMSSPTRCIVPFAARQFCEHAGRYHRSNHQYAVINTQTLMWKMCCHACTDAMGTWRPFDNTVAVRACFEAQMATWSTSLEKPAVKTDLAGQCIMDLRTIGPPALTQHRGLYQCRDGMYTWH